ncbi:MULTISPECIES: hemolysin family protein [unclassified Herbaspirillum]|uniref:hemolysin family protein n=1 Tax=unclassified Herbaspirillum TaxID=2624150 RepID=UPI00115216B5|nr:MULTISPECIES: hemolysin family protein [unclassified Herbaspirillum]MBB5390703.1 CBS domain containing-hemolysin-like protein [Herbaspirillum sp. SJZ102]TQK08811.1 CBS domain containing-hemolysin-like protein [Herbaspirillum sp. SJZ130]TQK14502.1 CBS domain containing-hemolysin-like protein [Herbaspirillum sp. SJZ106]
MENILLIVAAFFLVALNGFFVAAEFSLVKLRQTRIRAIAKTQGLRGRILAVVHNQLDAYLSACQLGITLASLGLGWIGEPAFARLLEPLFSLAGVTNQELIHGVSFVFAFFVISFLHIVAGELAPKSLAIRSPEKLGLWCALPLYGFYWGMYPLIWVLNASSNWLLRVAGLGGVHGHDAHYSSDELKLILRAGNKSGKNGKFTRDEWNVLAQSLNFAELDVADIMRPASEIVALGDDMTLEENLGIIYRNRFSRYPYFDAERQQVLGLVHLKDVFLAQQDGRAVADLKAYLRPVQYISPALPALDLLRRFRTGSPHFAIIGKKGQPPDGFITLDNMLSLLVGEIRDEFRHNTGEWTRQDDGSLLGKGSLPIVTLENMLGIDIEYDDSIDSVGGLVMEKLGDLPKEGQRIEFPAFDVVIKRMSGPKIVLVKVNPKLQEGRE